MRIKIENELNKLLGLPLEDMGRSGNLVWFSFGKPSMVEDRRGKMRKVSEYALNVQCSWRIIKEDQILVASRDIYIPSQRWKGLEEDFNWDVEGMNRCDERSKEFIRNTKFKIAIEKIQADNIGGVKLFFTEQYVLEILPDDSTQEEFWRFFIPGNLNSHFVVAGNGIEM